MCSLQSSPATSTTVIIYIGGLIQQGVSVAVLESHFYAIKWYHDFNFTSNPCSDKFLSLVIEGGRRILGKPVNKKEPFTPEMLRLIVSKYGDENDLSKLRVCVICLLGFSGFLRYSELSNIKMKNIIFHDSHVELTLDQSKTDIYRRGNTVVIAKTGNDLCPVTWLKKYVQLADLNYNPEFFIFRSLCFFKSQKTYTLNKNNRPLSYTRARDI
jgi:integrase